ncbi:Nucleolar and coiled-body phosphoprotein 1 (140 kDa nucleolar phosphoprotein) (Nopp140) (Hepatitis C virus NS5A-transactivated protein 13) (HCV NS5A-transactivated protein 13) (Nucleolar 130 kDa protein) (Nucleolar phosphoprotein p130) [Durusdinium trenchii]|uniref:Srp40 C-terminal domain-containing protein n=1 Tax=Durusdinium trenchii TaxID=1381693 RepID=A0ABP0Q7C0_9DINO
MSRAPRMPALGSNQPKTRPEGTAVVLAMKLNPSDIYPAVRRFLLESGLNRTLKALDKETSALEDVPVVKPKKAKALEPLELVAACQSWLDAQRAGEPVAPAAEPVAEEPLTPRPNKKRKREEEAAKAAEVEAEPEAAAVEQAEQAEMEVSVNKKSKKQKKEVKEDKSTPFKRIDDDKWRSTIKDPRLLDNTHLAKQKFGGSKGDSWADKASEDLLKTKGKGFRKEMAKKKRSSWRGGGEIDQGVNSIKFDDSDDE